jgi:hypothetical protein
MIIMANLLMTIHFLWAVFMVIGLPLGLWLRSPTLRWVHFVGMAITAFFAAAGMYCPLTIWEETLRWEADHSFSFEGGFLAHHLSAILYPQIEPWILRSASVLWGTLTVLAMIVIRPSRKSKG